MFAVGVSKGFSLLTSSYFRGVGPLCDYITGRGPKKSAGVIVPSTATETTGFSLATFDFKRI